jgi:hypothetical protein
MMFSKIAVAAALLVSASAANATNIIMNGGFESPQISDPCCTTAPGNGTVAPWTVGPNGNVNVVNGTYGSNNGNLAKEGTQYLDLIGEGGAGSISQSFSTVLNQVYTLTFSYSHNIFGGLSDPAPLFSANFSVGNLSGQLLGGSVSHSSGTNTNLDWQTFTGSFVGTGALETLNFTNTSPNTGNAGIFLDAISVSAAPEPATWMMMIGGFGVAGVAMRRRRRETLATV